MHEISTNYYTNHFTKWSGIGQENEFLIATILGTEDVNQLQRLLICII